MHKTFQKTRTLLQLMVTISADDDTEYQSFVSNTSREHDSSKYNGLEGSLV